MVERAIASQVVALALAAYLFTLAPSLARAEPDRFTIDYVRGAGAESCLDRTELLRLVGQRVGAEHLDDAAPRTIRARIEHHPNDPRWSAKVSVDGGAERTLTSAREGCTDIGEALVLVVALVIDPTAAARPIEPAPAAPPSPEAPAPPPPPAPPVAPVAPPPPRLDAPRPSAQAPGVAPRDTARTWLRLEHGGAAIAGWLPATSFAARSGISVGLPRFVPLVVSATYGQTVNESAPSYRASYGGWYATLLACPRLVSSDHVELAVSGGIDLGRLWVDASTPPRFANAAFSAARPAVDVAARAEVALRATPRFPVELLAGANGAVVLLREDVLARSGLSRRDSLAPASGSGDLSLAVRFR